MARARNIKPKFFQNDQLGELDPLARLLFIGMWTIADFRGVIEYRPKRLKAQVLPYDDCDIQTLVKTLDKSGFISIYSVQSQPYIKVLKFEAHQAPHKNEREGGSDLPDIDKKDNEISELTQDGFNPDKNGTTRAESLFLNPSSLFPLPESLYSESGQSIVEAIAPTVRRKAPVDSAASEVFTYWQQKLSHPTAKLDAKRLKAIKGRLADGYTVADLCLAVDGCAYDPFSQGQNDRQAVYDDIELICRDGPKVDKFKRIAERGPPTGRPANVQQTIDILQAYLSEHEN